MKVCSKCKEYKTLKEFGKDSHTKDGLRYRCKKCCNEEQRGKDKKKVQFTCESCGVTKEVDYYSNKKRKTNFCLKCVTKETQTGIHKCENKKRSYISTDGYKMVKIIGEYNSVNKPLYKREHIVVMEEYLGRKLKTSRGHMGEQVHHIDGNKLNNNIDNLLYCKDARDHKNIEYQLHDLAFELTRSGVISFDKNERRYKINWERINGTT